MVVKQKISFLSNITKLRRHFSIYILHLRVIIGPKNSFHLTTNYHLKPSSNATATIFWSCLSSNIPTSMRSKRRRPLAYLLVIFEIMRRQMHFINAIICRRKDLGVEEFFHRCIFARGCAQVGGYFGVLRCESMESSLSDIFDSSSPWLLAR